MAEDHAPPWGVTVDHGICVVEPASTRAGIYVAMTRGRGRNAAWVLDRTGLEDAEEVFATAIARPPARTAQAVREQLYRAAGASPPTPPKTLLRSSALTACVVWVTYQRSTSVATDTTMPSLCSDSASVALPVSESPVAAAHYAEHERLRCVHPALLADRVVRLYDQMSGGGDTVAITTASTVRPGPSTPRSSVAANPRRQGTSVALADGTEVFVGDLGRLGVGAGWPDPARHHGTAGLHPGGGPGRTRTNGRTFHRDPRRGAGPGHRHRPGASDGDRPVRPAGPGPRSTPCRPRRGRSKSRAGVATRAAGLQVGRARRAAWPVWWPRWRSHDRARRRPCLREPSRPRVGPAHLARRPPRTARWSCPSRPGPRSAPGAGRPPPLWAAAAWRSSPAVTRRLAPTLAAAQDSSPASW